MENKAKAVELGNKLYLIQPFSWEVDCYMITGTEADGKIFATEQEAEQFRSSLHPRLNIFRLSVHQVGEEYDQYKERYKHRMMSVTNFFDGTKKSSMNAKNKLR